MPVLITSALSSAAYQLARIIAIPDIVYADQKEMPAIPGVKNVILPDPSSMSFAHETLTLALDNRIETIYPLKLMEILELSAARQLFSEYGITLMIPSDEWLKNKSNISPLNSSKVIVVENGALKAGNFPQSVPEDFPETGVFHWTLSDGIYNFNLYLA